MLWPNTCTAARWHSTGSPTCAVAEEKSGSLMVQRRSVPAGTTVSCAREVGESSKDNVNARKTTNREVLRRMVFLPRTVRTAGGHTRWMDWTRAGRSKSCLNQKDVQRAKSTLMRKPKQEQIQKGKKFCFLALRFRAEYVLRGGTRDNVDFCLGHKDVDSSLRVSHLFPQGKIRKMK